MKMFLRGLPLVLAIFALVLVASSALAADATTNGTTSAIIMRQMYCGFKDLIGGTVGLMIGFVFVASGIWRLIQGASWWEGGMLVIFGAIVTATPGIVESSFTGFNQLLLDAGMTTVKYEPPCSSVVEPPKEDQYTIDDDANYYDDDFLD